jgi:molybdopterin synthase catalytic subunit
MIRVTYDDFSVDDELRRLKVPAVGGVVTFVGIVRAESGGELIKAMDIEVYPDMAEKQLATIREEALKQFKVEEVLIVHRYGDLRIGDNIVLIAVSAGHRKAAFDACEYVIDELKKRVPIWKREHIPSGTHWVEVGKPDEY